LVLTSMGIDQLPNLAVPGVPPQPEFREHKGVVHGDLERAARRLDQADVDAMVDFFQLGRQTGSPGVVVSDDAVLDADTHVALRR